MREKKSTPARMVVGGRVAEFGAFDEPFREVNLLDLDLVMRGKHVPRFVREFRLKEWEHFGIVTDEYYFGMVIFDAKYMGTSFFYAYNRSTGEFFEHERTMVAGPLRVARELLHGECVFRSIGYLMEFENRLDSGLHRLRVDIKARGGRPAVEAEIYVLEDLEKIEPLVIVSPVSENRPLYTHKTVAPVEGRVRLGDTEITLKPDRDVGLMDVQKTYYPYNTFWNWATFGGFDTEGRLLGMNVCRNFITEDEEYNENCTWVDGKINLLSAARFEFEKCDVLAPWRIRCTGGDLDLGFTPRGERRGRVSLGVVMSDFHQPFGTFAGAMSGPDAVKVDVDGMFGLCEHHLARF
ncbi:MAG: DUF2804 domain-containing protein [Actinomycetota bacterium]